MHILQVGGAGDGWPEPMIPLTTTASAAADAAAASEDHVSELRQDVELLEARSLHLEEMNLMLRQRLNSQIAAHYELTEKFEKAEKGWAAEKGRMSKQSSEQLADVKRLESSVRSLKFQNRELEVAKLELDQVCESIH